MTLPRRDPAGPIDWGAAREKLDRLERAAREALRPSPERARQILEDRARTLARVPPTPPRASEMIEVATFALANEDYAIETRFVRRIVKLDQVTPVPGAAGWLSGVINLGGEILAVFDLRVLFGIAREGPTEWSRVIVLGVDRDEFGIIANAADEVRAIRLDQIFTASESHEGFGRQYLRGTTAETLVVLDGAVLLRDERLVIDQVDEPGA